MVAQERAKLDDGHAVHRAINSFLLVYPGFNRKTLSGYVDKPNVPLAPGKKRHGTTIGRSDVVTKEDIEQVASVVREMKLPTASSRQRGQCITKDLTILCCVIVITICRCGGASVQAPVLSLSKSFVFCNMDKYTFP
jgi:hypothetical protein